MTDITELPAKWRKEAFELQTKADGSNAASAKFMCAKNLKQSLPKWTRITEDEITHNLPDEFLGYFSNGSVEIYQLKTGHNIDASLTYSGLTHWRPLCSIDTPPEQAPTND